MPRFTLIRFDRYVAAKSEVIYHNTYETNLGLAFKEVLIELWNGKKFEEEDKNDIWEWEKMKGYGDKIGMDFEEESYLFFEG
jgi:transposase